MRKLTSLIVALLMLISAAGCRDGNKSGNAEKVYKLRMTSSLSESGVYSKGMKAWAEELAKRTNGQVVIDQMTWSGTIVKADNNLEGLRDRLVDVAFISVTNHPNKTPLTNALIPSFSSDFAGAGAAQEELWNTVPELKEEWAKYKVVPVAWFNGYGANLYTNFTVDPDANSPLAEQKIFATGAQSPIFVKNLGGIPVSMPSADIYVSMQKGTIKGIAGIAPFALSTNKFGEITNQVTDYRVTGSTMWTGIAFNQDAYNELPDSAKQVIAEIADIPAQVCDRAFNDSTMAGYKIVEQNGGTLVQLTEEQAADWQEMIKPEALWEANIKTAEAAGYKNVRELLAKEIQIMEDYDAQHPHKTLLEQYFELKKENKI
ncbi:MAG TPA: TRAP transporter substrate-binding protein DctP [Syntrophomonas sp.]|nr:TRAP transporter substrate-binding protein DctP [Syntrophomonas sp.]